MPELATSVVVDTGPEAIWKLMCDPATYPDYVVMTDRMVDVGNGEFGVGYEYAEYGGVKPFKGESRWTVTEFDPMRHQHHVGDDGKVKVQLDMDLVPQGESTELRMHVRLEPRWYVMPVLAVMWPAKMRRTAQTEMDETARNIKRMAESAT